MIIYGWGRRKVSKFGPRRAYHCNNCNNDAYWELVKISTWFTLFFIPVIPYEIKRLLMCPVCGAYIEISSEEFKQLKNMNVNSREDIDNYGKTETQINFIKQIKEIKEEKNDSETGSNNSVVVLNDSVAQNNNDIEKNNDKASILTRVLARLIDIAIPLVISLVSFFDSDMLNAVGGLAIMATSIIQIFLVSISEQTIGKKILKIKVVRVDTNTNGGFSKNFVLREFINTALYITAIYAIADIVCIFRKDRRCVHDLIAGTKVIKA